MVDYVECIDGVTTLTITPKPGAVGSSPSTPANLGLRLYKGFKGLLKDLRDPFFLDFEGCVTKCVTSQIFRSINLIYSAFTTFLIN